MTITLSEQELKQLSLANTQPQPFPEDDGQTDFIQQCPPHLGRGYMRWIPLRDIILLIHNYELQENLMVLKPSVLTNCVEFGFRISGTNSVHRAGQNFLLNGPTETRIIRQSRGEKILQVDIHVRSLELLGSFLLGKFVEIPAIEQLFENAGKQRYYQPGRITLAMQMALNQLLNCPYRGLTRQIYLESKCYELVALKLEQLIEGDRNCPTKTDAVLALDDIERIHQAKDILIANLNNPPSLPELAHRVAMNDHKLKKGFRQVFGTTAFSYLLHYRLEQARQLLAKGEMSVTEVAHKVGFADRSYFTKAFCKQFGLTPGAYRRSQRGTFYTR